MKAVTQFIRSIVAMSAIAAMTTGCSDESPVAAEAVTGAGQARGSALGRMVQIRERPIEEFVLAQGGVAGSGMGASLGPTGGAIAWVDRSLDVAVVVDYAGSIHRRESRWSSTEISPIQAPISTDPDVVGVPMEEVKPALAGPQYSGRIIEQILPDGSARVVIDLRTVGALSFAGFGSGDVYEKLFFGAMSYADAAAALGESHLVVAYRTPFAGAPMPSLSRLIYEPQKGEIVEQITFTASAIASILPPAYGRAAEMKVDFQAFGGLWGSLGAIGTLSGATASFQ